MPRNPSAPMPPVDPDHRENKRDDTHRDFAELRATGRVRNKQGDIVGIDEPATDFTPRQRDALYQAYCAFASPVQGGPVPDDTACKAWIKEAAASVIGAKTGNAISPGRAADLIGQGNGEWTLPEGANAAWWRGCSL